MEEKFLETLVVSFTTTLLNESKALFDEVYDTASDEIKQFIGKDIKNYLNKQKDKYSHIKTLLRGNTPVYLYDIYFPAKLEDEHGVVIGTESSNKLFKDINFLTIIGDAGSGKSTLMKHLFLNSIYEKNKIPILIELRYLNDSTEELEMYVKNTISQNKLSVNNVILEKLLDKGKFILFLDGFDEVDEKTKKKLVKQLNDFVNKYNDNCFVLTSRPYSNIENLALFVNLRMKDLSLENGEIRGFVFKQLGSEEELAEKAIKSIEQGDSKYIHSFLKNPLLLSLYLLTFQNYASIPDKKYIFYRRVINALFSEHDSRTKLGFVREKLCGLDQEGFESVLKSFSFLSYFENEFSFNRDYINFKLKIIKDKKALKFDNNKFLTDLKSAISLWIDDDGMFSFAHRSLQEYFTALFITELKPEENNRVYNKIIKIYEDSKDNRSREVENLLQLLKEMDEYNYIKCFYHPLLLDVQTQILNGSKSSNSRNYLNFFMAGIASIPVQDRNETEDNVHYSTIVKNNIYKTIYIHLPFTEKLYSYLSTELNKNKVFEKYDNLMLDSNKMKRNNYQLRGTNKHTFFDDDTFELFYNELDDSRMKIFTTKILIYIDKQIKYCKEFIDRVDSTEKDLVDLI